MIAIENKTGFVKNECFVIVNSENKIVEYKSFKSRTNRRYYFSNGINVPSLESQFETLIDANIALSKCKRIGEVKKLVFENEDVSSMYKGEGANILGFDFANQRIWIESKDKSKYGYDYRSLTLINP